MADLLLLHLNTDLTDSQGRHTLTNNNTSISSTQKQFGAASLYYDVAASAPHIYFTDNLADVTFSGDFTIDAWIWLTNSTAGFQIFNENSDNFHFYAEAGGTNLACYATAFGYQPSGVSLSLNTWTHCAVTRSGGTMRIFVNGTQAVSWSSSATLSPNAGCLFGKGPTGTQQTRGYIDEIRIANTAIWTSNFTPPTSEYGAAGDSVTVDKASVSVAGGTVTVADTGAYFIDGGSIGTGAGSATANQATLAMPVGINAPAGSLAVVVIADDNIGTADGDDNTVSAVADNSGFGNVWIKAGCFANGQGTAQTGASVSVFYAILKGTGFTGTQTITATFTNATLSDATGMIGRWFTIGNQGADHAWIGTLANDAADPGSLNVTTFNQNCLRIRAIAGEVGTATNLTPTSGWTAWATGQSATTGTTAAMSARAEHIISTATGAASDPTWVACDNASLYVVFTPIGAIPPFNRPPRFWKRRIQ